VIVLTRPSDASDLIIASCDLCPAQRHLVDVEMTDALLGMLRDWASAHNCPGRDAAGSPYRRHVKVTAP
jgi:hypothetical protein